MKHTSFRYTPFYCEENIWHLCQEAEFSGLTRKVVFISNERRVCPIWGQKAALSQEEPVWWDYHVLLLCLENSWMLWDLDTLIGFPAPVERYLHHAFSGLDKITCDYAPLFRVIDTDEYVKAFSSDRSHMRTSSGGWAAPPPPWPAIAREGTSNLMKFIDMTSEWIGEVMTLREFRDTFEGQPSEPRQGR